MACHSRSNSLPTRSHSFVLKAEEELNRARAFVGSSSLTYEIMLDAIQAVERVYESINDLLSMSSNQNNLSQWQQRRWLDQELEESVRLLDICSTSRENSRKTESLDGESLACASIMIEAREIILSLLQAVFSSFCEQIAEKKCGKWSLASKLLHKRTGVYNGENGDNVLDIASLLVNVEGLDSGLECLFRHLIQCRVSLLNLCTL